MRAILNGRLLEGGHDAARWAEWWVVKDGLTGWYSAPASRAESEEVPDGDGGYWPGRFLVGSRHIGLTIGHATRTSSLARAEAEDWVASLRGDLTFAVRDEHGQREVTAFRSGEPDYEQLDYRTATFGLILTAPDPLKYGPPVPFSGTSVRNAGREAVLPWRIVVTGSVTTVLVVLGGHRIRWVGSAPGVVIDTRVGTATTTAGVDVTTGLIEDDIPLLLPGVTSMSVTSDAASVVVEVRPGWM